VWQLAEVPGADKLEVGTRAGGSVWQDEVRCWCPASEPTGLDTERTPVPALSVTSLGLFVLCEALVDMAVADGYETWASRGEVNVLGLLPAQEEDVFVIEPQLSLRAVREQYIDVHATLQFRRRMRWRVAGHLGDPRLHHYAVGEWVVRLRGPGPRSARLARVSTEELVLESGDQTISVFPLDYAPAAKTQVVGAWRGHEVLRWLQIATGSSPRRGGGTCTRGVDCLGCGHHTPVVGAPFRDDRVASLDAHGGYGPALGPQLVGKSSLRRLGYPVSPSKSLHVSERQPVAASTSALSHDPVGSKAPQLGPRGRSQRGRRRNRYGLPDLVLDQRISLVSTLLPSRLLTVYW
jgi:hypothetical protein